MSGPVARTGAETGRFRAFYDRPEPVEFDAELPDDLDGPDDERDFLLDAAPFSRQRAVRVERAVLGEGVVQGATNPAQGYVGSVTSGNDGSGDLRAEALKLARLLDPTAFDDRAVPSNLGQSFDRYSRQQTAMDHATIALIRGYRLVVDDDTTVERVGQVIMHALARVAGEDYDSPKAAWSEVGRAAVRALREEQ